MANVTGNISGTSTQMWSTSAQAIVSSIDWMHAELNYTISLSSDKKSYIITTKMRVISNYEMMWAVYNNNDVKITMSCNGTTLSPDGTTNGTVSFIMNNKIQSGTGKQSTYTNEVTFTYTPSQTYTTISLSGALDFSGMEGIDDNVSYGKGGPVSTSNHDLHYNKMTCSGNVNVSSIPIEINSPPSLTNLTVRSITTSSATITANVASWGTPSATGSWECRDENNSIKASGSLSSGSTSFNVTGLSPATAYTVYLTLSNSSGNSATRNVSFTTSGNPPTLNSISNGNALSGNTGISASTNSITVNLSVGSWGNTGGTAYYQVNGGSAVSIGQNTSFTVNNLTAGASYTIRVYITNSVGTSEKTITIRTKYNNPTVGISIKDIFIDKLVFSWTSNLALGSSSYSIDGGANWIQSGTGTSGTITINTNPNTNISIQFKGISTSVYDSLTSNTASTSSKTKDIAHITAITNPVFGTATVITVTNASSKTVSLKIWVLSNASSPFTFSIANGATSFTFNPTQDQLDLMYKNYTNTNSIPIYFLLTTPGDRVASWNDTQQNKTLALTGIAKTAHIGVANTPRRCQLWIGGANNVPRRAVGWIGVANTPRRTI